VTMVDASNVGVKVRIAGRAVEGPGVSVGMRVLVGPGVWVGRRVGIDVGCRIVVAQAERARLIAKNRERSLFIVHLIESNYTSLTTNRQSLNAKKL